LQKWKFEKVKHEMTRLGINVVGISERRWHGDDDYETDGFRIIHSGSDEILRGVAIMLDKKEQPPL